MKTTRRIVQCSFLALVLSGVFLWRAALEPWCPFGGVEAVYTYFSEGNMLCSLGVSNFYILGSIIVMTLLLRRAFCGYLCPIGAISEWLHAGAARLGVKKLRVPPRLDRGLSLLKYVLLALILWFTWQAGELIFRGFCPYYAMISRHGADITLWAYVVLSAIAIVSLAVMAPFCRWFCPLAAVLNPLSRFGLMRIRRTSSCIACGRCAEECPMAIPVDRVEQVTASRCMACMNCVDVCPKDGALQWTTSIERHKKPFRPFLTPRIRQAMLIVVLLLCVTGAVAATFFFPLPSFIKASKAKPPAEIASVNMKIANLTCRGRANLLVWFLERDDQYQIPSASPDEQGYYKLEAWPNPALAETRISYDPAHCDVRAIQEAIAEPYYDAASDRWWMSPFVIEDYDPLGP